MYGRIRPESLTTEEYEPPSDEPHSVPGALGQALTVPGEEVCGAPTTRDTETPTTRDVPEPETQGWVLG